MSFHASFFEMNLLVKNFFFEGYYPPRSGHPAFSFGGETSAGVFSVGFLLPWVLGPQFFCLIGTAPFLVPKVGTYPGVPSSVFFEFSVVPTLLSVLFASLFPLGHKVLTNDAPHYLPSAYFFPFFSPTRSFYEADRSFSWLFLLRHQGHVPLPKVSVDHAAGAGNLFASYVSISFSSSSLFPCTIAGHPSLASFFVNSTQTSPSPIRRLEQAFGSDSLLLRESLRCVRPSFCHPVSRVFFSLTRSRPGLVYEIPSQCRRFSRRPLKWIVLFFHQFLDRAFLPVISLSAFLPHTFHFFEATLSSASPHKCGLVSGCRRTRHRVTNGLFSSRPFFSSVSSMRTLPAVFFWLLFFGQYRRL